jgi:hypothetical protein
MSNFRNVHARSRAGFQAAISEAEAEFLRAEAAGDEDGQVAATQQVAGLEASKAFLEARAQQEYQRRAPQRTAKERAEDMENEIENRRLQLTPQQRSIARTAFSAPDMTNEQMEATYVRNRMKLEKMRASGEYPDVERN